MHDHVHDSGSVNLDTAERLRAHLKTQKALNGILQLLVEPQGDLIERMERVLAHIMSVPWMQLSPKGGIMLAREDGLELVASHSLGAQIEANCALVKLGHCLCGRAALSRELLHATCMDERHETVLPDMTPHGHYVMPIVLEEQTVAVLVLYVPHGHTRDDDQVEFLNATANILAGLIDQDRTRQALIASRREALAHSEAKSRFLATMSHEIRTPLNGVLGTASLMADTPLDDVQRELVDTLVTSGKLLQGLLDDVLDMSKIEAGMLRLDRKPLDLAKLVGRAVDLFTGPAMSKGIALRSRCDEAPMLIGDGMRLTQIVNNLVGNAIKFTHSGQVALDATFDGDRLHLRVSDTGIGMTPGHCAAIFEPFQQATAQTATRFGGTGLGLSICRQLAGLMDGTLTVQSQVGRGSTFHLELPLPRAGATPSTAMARQRGPARPLRLLVADDNPVNRMVLSRMVQANGHVAIDVADGAQAVQAALSSDFDALLMDCQMPIMSGLEAAQLLRDKGYEGTIIAVTAHALSTEVQACLDAGMNSVLTKPIDRGQLVEALAALSAR